MNKKKPRAEKKKPRVEKQELEEGDRDYLRLIHPPTNMIRLEFLEVVPWTGVGVVLVVSLVFVVLREYHGFR